MGEPIGLWEFAECVKQGDLHVLEGAKAVGFSSRDSRLVVEALGGAVGEGSAGGKPVEQLGWMLAEGSGDILDCGQE